MSAEIVKLIREHYGCGMLEASEKLQRAALDEKTPTKRELFAAMAMQSLFADYMAGATAPNINNCAVACIKMADALLEELAKGER